MTTTPLWQPVYDELGLVWDQTPDVPDKTLSHYVREFAEQHGDRAALVFGGFPIPYAELDRRTDQLAHLLRSLGMERGDVLGVHLPNLPQYVVAFAAAARLGVVVTSLSPMLRPPELAFQIDDAQVSVLLTMAPLLAAVQPIGADRPRLTHVLVAGPTDLVPPAPTFTDDGAPLGSVQVRALQPMLDAQPETPVPDDASIHDVLYLQYTGGTTGSPKGAQLSSYNLFCNNVQVDLFYRYRVGREVVASAFPFFHIGGAALLFNGLRTASTNILVPNPRDLPAFIGEMQERAPTAIAAVPALYQMLCAQPGFREIDFSGLRIAVSGGAPFSEDGIAALEAIVGSGRFCEVYGMTETSPVQTINPPTRLKPGFVGIPVPGTHLRIVDRETGATLPPNTPGEVVVSGPQVMRGYANRPDESAHALQEFAGRTWMHTGDIGFLDDEGYLKICDRAKDMLIVGGFKVFSVEVENKVAARPEVAMCAVVGVPDEERPGNEIVCLYVHAVPGADVGEDYADSLRAWCRQEMAPYKVPRRVEILEALPLTSVGKVDKIALRELARG